jgi:hypothetical protein
MAHVTSTVDAVIRGSALIQGDISSAVHTPFTDSTPVNKPMVAVGGGFILGINKSTAIELGARYLGIFTDEPAIHAMNIFGGFRSVSKGDWTISSGRHPLVPALSFVPRGEKGRGQRAEGRGS